MSRYPEADFAADYPDAAACLAALMQLRLGAGLRVGLGARRDLQQRRAGFAMARRIEGRLFARGHHTPCPVNQSLSSAARRRFIRTRTARAAFRTKTSSRKYSVGRPT